MKVPLAAYVQEGVMFLSYNERFRIVDPPESYLYEVFDEEEADTVRGHVVGQGEKWLKKRLVDFHTWKELGSSNYPFGYGAHLFASQPDWVRKYPQEQKLRIMYFDIEVGSDGSGLFPKAERNPIVMIGCQIDDNDIVIFDNYHEIEQDRYILEDFLAYIKDMDPDVFVGYNSWSFDMPYIFKRCRSLFGGEGERWIDIIMGKDKINVETSNIETSVDKLLYTQVMNIEAVARTCTRLGRRIHYDIYKVDVLRDQKLSDLKNKKMKTLGKHFLKDQAEEVVELDHMDNLMEMMNNPEGRERLKTYLRSDVWVTHKLCNVYFDMDIEAAEQLGLPLETILSRTNGTISSMHLLTNALNHGIYPLEANRDQYAHIYQLAEENGSKKGYQGAYVGVMRPNEKIAKPLFKYDFASLYPSIIRQINLSYETVRFDPRNDVLPLTEEYIDEDGIGNRLRAVRLGNDLELYMPDLVLDRVIRIHIDMSKQGLLPGVIEDLFTRRLKLKAEIKDLRKQLETEPDNTELPARITKLDTNQNLVKVIMNSIYGVLANKGGVGYLPIGIAITAMGRWITSTVASWYPEHRVEIDTDGILFDIELDEEELNSRIKSLLKETFDIDESYLVLEKERFERGYIYRMKNYLLLERSDIRDPKTNEIIDYKDKEIIHGAFFKSSRKSKVEDNAVRMFIDWALHDKRTPEEVVEKSLDINDCPLDWFQLSVRISKNVEDYGKSSSANQYDSSIATHKFNPKIKKTGYRSQQGSLIVGLAQSYKERFGAMPGAGDVIDYIVIRDPLTGRRKWLPYIPDDEELLSLLDVSHYTDSIIKFFKALNMPVEEKGNKLCSADDIWDML